MVQDSNKQDSTLRNTLKRFPWIALLFWPRQTIRELLETETEKSTWNSWVVFTIVLVVVALILGYLQNALWGEPNLPLKGWLLGLSVLVIINLFMFYLGSYFFWKTSLWLGGHSEKSQMRIVYAWATIIPTMTFGLIDIFFTLLLGKENIIVLIVNNIGFLWSAAIAVASVREITNLSIWKAGIVWMSPYLLIMGVIISIIVASGLAIWLLMKVF